MKDILSKLKSVELCLSAHPHNEPNSEFADRITDLIEISEQLKYKEDAIKQLQLKFQIAENALNGILMLDDYDNAPDVANSAIEKLAKIDGF